MRNSNKSSYYICAALLSAFLAQGASAQTNPYPVRSQPQPSLTKAGATTQRPAVPNRNVNVPVYQQSRYYYGEYRGYARPSPRVYPQGYQPNQGRGDGRLDSYQYEQKSSSGKPFVNYENSD